MWKSLTLASALFISSMSATSAQIIEPAHGSAPGSIGSLAPGGSQSATRQLSQNGSAVIVVPVVTILALMFLAERN